MHTDYLKSDTINRGYKILGVTKQPHPTHYPHHLSPSIMHTLTSQVFWGTSFKKLWSRVQCLAPEWGDLLDGFLPLSSHIHSSARPPTAASNQEAAPSCLYPVLTQEPAQQMSPPRAPAPRGRVQPSHLLSSHTVKEDKEVYFVITSNTYIPSFTFFKSSEILGCKEAAFLRCLPKKESNPL